MNTLLIGFRPHKLNPIELYELEQRITELELELPRRATDYEYAAWQVKDQLRQARGIEAKLGFNTPSTEDTRRLQHRVAQIRVFLEQASRFTFLQKFPIYWHLHCGFTPIITELSGNFTVLIFWFVFRTFSAHKKVKRCNQKMGIIFEINVNNRLILTTGKKVICY